MQEKAIREQVCRMPSSARSIVPPASLITCTSAPGRAGSCTLTLIVCVCVEACPGAVGSLRVDSSPPSWQGGSTKPRTLSVSQLRSCMHSALFQWFGWKRQLTRPSIVPDSHLIMNMQPQDIAHPALAPLACQKACFSVHKA